MTGDNWTIFNITYDPNVVSGLGMVESNLSLARHEDVWEAPQGFANIYGVNTALDYVWANVSDFSVFAPMEVDITQVTNCVNISTANTIYNLTTNLTGVQGGWDR